MKSTKDKIVSKMLLVLMLVLSMIPTLIPTMAKAGAPTSGTVLWVDPSLYNATAEGKTVCQNFTIDIAIYNITNLWAGEYTLTFNGSLISCNSMQFNTAVWGSDGLQPKKTIETNRIIHGMSRLSGSAFSGSAVIATVEFHVEHQPSFPAGDGDCLLQLANTTLGDDQIPSQPISHTTQDGQYVISSVPPTPPVAIFTENTTMAYINETIGFDASSSYDSDGTITNYDWDFGDTNTATGVTTTHSYTAVGSYTVNLTVTDNDGQKDWATSTKTVTERPVGCFLDVYSSHLREYPQPSWTPFIGEKTGVACDAFAPGENTTLYAKVTFNDAPVNHILVAFEGIFDPDNLTGRGPACQFFRTAETNKDGICEISFRVPMPCEDDVMGKWLVTVTAKVQSVKQNDTMPFDVGYILSVAELSTNKLGVPETSFEREVDCIQVVIRVKNIALIAKNVTVIAVLYDICEVPLGQVILQTEAAFGVYCSPAYTTFTPEICVPQWAYVGAGKVYVSLFTAIPSECGIPYSPEAETDIVITWTP